MTIALEVAYLEAPTPTSVTAARSAGMAPEERQVEGADQGAVEPEGGERGGVVEPEGDNGGQRERENRGEEAKRERLPEESLRMTSWVEVEKERRSAEENEEEEEEEEEEQEEEEQQPQHDKEDRNVSERDAEEEKAEKEQTRSVEEELATMEEKWKEQCAINETLKQRLANEEERFRVSATLQSHYRSLYFLYCTSFI